MNAEYRIRAATPDDAAVIAHHRAAMFHEMNSVNGEEADKLESEVLSHLRLMLADWRYAGWLIEYNGDVIAGAGALVNQVLPRPGVLEGGAGVHIVNVYTEPEHRRRGLARELMLVILNWCQQHRIAVITLAASEDGRPLYESLGFVQMNHMIWKREER